MAIGIAMKLTASELKTIERKTPTREDINRRRLSIVRAGRGNKTVEQLQKDLEKAGIFNAIATIRSVCQKENIEYFKRSSHPNKKKKGAPIIIGKV